MSRSDPTQSECSSDFLNFESGWTSQKKKSDRARAGLNFVSGRPNPKIELFYFGLGLRSGFELSTFGL